MQGGIDSPEQRLDAHGDALYRYALVRLRDAHKAEEAVQETLLAALQARERSSGWCVGAHLVDRYSQAQDPGPVPTRST